MTECFFGASRGSSLTHGWPRSQSGADMRPGRRSVTTSFLPGPHFSPRGEASTWGLSLVDVIYLLRGCLVVVSVAPPAAASQPAHAALHQEAAHSSFCESVVCFFFFFLIKMCLLNTLFIPSTENERRDHTPARQCNV